MVGVTVQCVRTRFAGGLDDTPYFGTPTPQGVLIPVPSGETSTLFSMNALQSVEFELSLTPSQ
jgi:hypothetical protein